MLLKHFTIFLVLTLCLIAGAQAQRGCYDRDRLVSDGRMTANVIDRELTAPWGVAFGPTGGSVVANHVSRTVMRFDGAGQRLARYTTGSLHGTGVSAVPPTVTGFTYTVSGVRRRAEYVIATREGRVLVQNDDLTRLFISFSRPAMYTGVSVGTNGRMYLADFQNRKVDVVNNRWQRFIMPADRFIDPDLPADFSPFNVLFAQGMVIVSYARFDGDHLPAEAAGAGFVSMFDASGRFVRRLAIGGRLNAPWGLAVAPDNFGPFAGRLLIGNHGDVGLISSVTLTGTQATNIQSLRIANGTPWAAAHLWGIAFGNGQLNQPTSTLYFTAAMRPEVNGVYGRTWNVPCPA